LSLATTTIATGSLGNQIRNDIEQRKEWVKLIEETRKFFVNNPQFALAELYYSQRLDLASINYTTETANLSFPLQVRINNERANALTKIVSDIYNGLEATGRRERWGISITVDPILFAYIFDFELVDERGRVISTASSNAFFLFWDGSPLHRFSLSPYFIYAENFGGYTRNKIINVDQLNSSTNLVWDGIEYYRWINFRYPTVHYGGFSNHEDFILQFNVVGYLSSQDKEEMFNQNRSNIQERATSLFNDTSFLFNKVKLEVENLAEYISPGFIVRAQDITNTLSIRVKNISVYDLPKPNTGRRGLINLNISGNNIIHVKAEMF